MSMWFTLNVKSEAALPFKPAHQTRIKAAEATQSAPPGAAPPPHNTSLAPHLLDHLCAA